MSEQNPIAPIGGDFGPAAKALVERVSDFIGGCFKPQQIRRVASAEAEAALMRAGAEIEITDLQRRAAQRRLAEDERAQLNIEGVVRKALPNLRDDAAPEKIDDDWMAAFFEEARIVSNEEMQSLWGRILAGEANRAGSFSKRTLGMVSDLDKRDAEMFTELCRYGWRIGTTPTPLVFDFKDKIYTDHGVNLDALIHLDDIGLISFSVLEFPHKERLPELVVSYSGAEFLLGFDEGDDYLGVGHAPFTQPGAELFTICVTKPVDNFADYVTEHWFSRGLRIACVLPS
jgi:hypothetical protein